MIQRDYFKTLSDAEKAKYKFEFCYNCPFYECELIDEYMRFRKNRAALDKRLSESLPESPISNSRVVSSSEAPLSKSRVAFFTTQNLSYGRTAQDRCYMKQGLQKVECGRQRVAEGIGNDFEIDIYDYTYKIKQDAKWEPKQPVFISAQTGQGKNYFIENTLLPYVRELNHKKGASQKVLIISNRIALRLQVESRLKGRSDAEFDSDAINSYGQYADIVTYQGLLKSEKRLKSIQDNKEKRYARYSFVICDEALFFTSDAMFNCDTERILSAIVRTFSKAIRIYMSATLDECLPYIDECESRMKSYDKYMVPVFYHFKRDYSYLDIKYFSHNRELEELIVSSVTRDRENWLIFIDNIEKGEEFKRTLESYDGMADKVFAVSKNSKNLELYQKMVRDEKLGGKTKVLIATSVIDNGVNFRGIHNVVVSDMSKIKCLQMVGRARIASEQDKITLCMKRFNREYVERRIAYMDEQLDAYHDYDMMAKGGHYKDIFLNKYFLSDEDDWKHAKNWFGTDSQLGSYGAYPIYLNGIARSQAEKLLKEYKDILEEMRQTDEGADVTGQKYLEYQLSWFGKTYIADNDITLVDKDEANNDFIVFLHSCADGAVPMDKEAQQVFSEKFTSLHDAAFGRTDPNLDRNYGLNKMNDILKNQDILFKVDSRRQKGAATHWVVVQHNWHIGDGK